MRSIVGPSAEMNKCVVTTMHRHKSMSQLRHRWVTDAVIKEQQISVGMADIEWQKADFDRRIGDGNLAAVEVLHFVNISSEEGVVLVEDVLDSKPIVDGAPQEGAIFIAVNLVVY